MKKNKFFKNLFQSISYFSVVLIFVFFLIFGYIVSLKYENNSGWILLIIAILLVILFFIIGFYWIFQKVIISETGIKICFLKKIIKQCCWEEITSIKDASIMRNPSLKIKLYDGSEIHLDKRKSIILAIETYSTKREKESS